MKTRDPWLVGLLGVLTLGLYFAWYYFIAFREVDYAQGRKHSGLIFLGLLPIFGPIFVIVYVSRELQNLAADRAQVGFGSTLTGSVHFLLVLAGLIPALTVAVVVAPMGEPMWLMVAVLVNISPVVASIAVAKQINEYAARVGRAMPA